MRQHLPSSLSFKKKIHYILSLTLFFRWGTHFQIFFINTFFMEHHTIRLKFEFELKHKLLHSVFPAVIIHHVSGFKRTQIIKNLSETCFIKFIKFLISQQLQILSDFIRESGAFLSWSPCCYWLLLMWLLFTYSMIAFMFSVCCGAKCSQIVVDCLYLLK